eukprot:TRINITY_DN428_c0_g1_i1.p1 TRINITY_DN428_c0_g1~~TRINITY_DN428_c0_g1_i1.p1  ORF type:complete len:263 (+),score=26.81 TRINITY_DN428_c0_g1_i1:241-1029(+)
MDVAATLTTIRDNLITTPTTIHIVNSALGGVEVFGKDYTTLQHAWTYLLTKYILADVTIQLTCSISTPLYVGDTLFSGHPNANKIIIRGNPSDPNSCHLQHTGTGTMLTFQDTGGSVSLVTGFTLLSNGVSVGNAIHALNMAKLTIDHINIGNFGGGMWVSSISTVIYRCSILPECTNTAAYGMRIEEMSQLFAQGIDASTGIRINSLNFGMWLLSNAHFAGNMGIIMHGADKDIACSGATSNCFCNQCTYSTNTGCTVMTL